MHITDKSSPTNNSITTRVDSSTEEYSQKGELSQNSSNELGVLLGTLSRNSSGDNSESLTEWESTKSSTKIGCHTSSKSIPQHTLKKSHNNSLSVPPGGRHTSNNATHTPPTYHPTDPQEEFYSLCFQKFEPLAFYSGLVEKVLQQVEKLFGSICTVLWGMYLTVYHLYSSVPANPSHTLGAPLSGFINQWLQAETVNLFLIEVLYIAFMCATGGRSDPVLRVTENHSEKNTTDHTEDDLTMYTPWGCNVPAVLCQLMLLQHWLSKFEKLSTAHKKAIWNTCKLLHVFNNYNEGSFKLTFQQWAANPLINLMNISIFFASIGFLRECGILKYDFCYPKTTHPVFEVNQDLSALVSQQHIPLGLITSDNPRPVQQRQEEALKQPRKEDVVHIPPLSQHELQERLQALVGLAPMRPHQPPPPFFPPRNNTHFTNPSINNNNNNTSPFTNNNNTTFSNNNLQSTNVSSTHITVAETIVELNPSHQSPHVQIVHPYRRNSKVDLTTLVTARRMSQGSHSEISVSSLSSKQQTQHHSHEPHGSGIIDVGGSGSFNHKGHRMEISNTSNFTLKEPTLDLSDTEDSPRSEVPTPPPTDTPPHNSRKRRSVEIREQTVKKMSIQSLIS